MELNIDWNIGKGDVSFWFDNWCPLGPLYMITTHKVPLPNIKLNEILQNNIWNWNSLTIQPNEDTKSHLLSLGIELENNCYDTANRRLSKSGKFIISSTWNAITQRKDHNPLYKNLWTKNIPFKMSFLLWRAVGNKLYTDKSVTRLGITLTPQCYYCNSTNSRTDLEDTNHIFYQGELARKMWRNFAGPLGIGWKFNNLNMTLLTWWNHKSQNPISRYITKNLPHIICWELWRSRCGNNYEGTRPSMHRTCSNVTSFILQMIKKQFTRLHIGDNWSSLYAACDAQIQQTSNITVRWLRPPAQIVKLNSDGSCSNEQCGGGGIIRNQEGKFIMAYFIPLGEGTSNYAEAEALLFGLKWCVDKDLKMAIGESDSLLIVKCVKREWKPPWNISKQIKEIQKMIEDHNFNINHCFREANRPADSLATLSHRIEGNMIFNIFSDLPNHIKGLVNMDKWGLPTFRIKHTKPSNIIYNPP
ncbi:uncharacterized protein [Nicotiana sylvestris]|uniref:Uncharacterized protein LOC104218042 n=1 Tax=Nicotiana sylvestris TaxID=4096 RepID=A0A1U7VXN5_NICSY|nr:PREDICTED: uncharacterized protein LOC104218042 [Nicotiana sylvestris]